MIVFYGDLYNQVRDDENAITMKIKCSASEFSKVIKIPTRQLLKISVEPVNSNSDSQSKED
jgi:hypothetical protein